jgi:acyl-CoA hydrolase
MEIGIKVITENIQQGLVRHTNSCYFTMVAVDENRKPVQVPPLQTETEEQKRRFEQAAQRREYRKSQGM